MGTMSLSALIRSDYEAGSGRPWTGWLAYLPRLAVSPGLLACLLLRIQQVVERRSSALAKVVFMANSVLTGAEFWVGSRVGHSLRVHHPRGIVVGVGASIGNNCHLMHNVTLGQRDLSARGAEADYPSVGDGVTLSVGCALLGAISVGGGAVVGANSVVLIDVPARGTAVGVPARLVGGAAQKAARLSVVS